MMPEQVRGEHRHFSMVREFHLADLFTIANGFCGVAAVFQAMKFLALHDRRHVYFAALLVPVALVFDVLDGRIARWRHRSSPMGRELDSLADVISFGVAPAAIAFAAGLNTFVDQVILMYFVGCGVSRLARFNVTAETLSAGTGKVKYFEGTPIPTSVVPLGLVMLAFAYGELFRVDVGVSFHLLSLLFLVSGSLMISKTLHVPKP
jgi:CDP-diacylglycerol--serine O-phosphatidyltransferase